MQICKISKQTLKNQLLFRINNNILQNLKIQAIKRMEFLDHHNNLKTKEILQILISQVTLLYQIPIHRYLILINRK